MLGGFFLRRRLRNYVRSVKSILNENDCETADKKLKNHFFPNSKNDIDLICRYVVAEFVFMLKSIDTKSLVSTVILELDTIRFDRMNNEEIRTITVELRKAKYELELAKRAWDDQMIKPHQPD